MRIIKQIAQEYNVNSKALKRYVKESGLKPKRAERVQVLKILYINCSSLFYCRDSELDGAIEYLDHISINRLIEELNNADVEVSAGGEI